MRWSNPNTVGPTVGATEMITETIPIANLRANMRIVDAVAQLAASKEVWRDAVWTSRIQPVSYSRRMFVDEIGRCL